MDERDDLLNSLSQYKRCVPRELEQLSLDHVGLQGEALSHYTR